MLIIRLQRIGKKNQAYFRIVVLEHTKKPQGEFLELLGSYNPHQKEFKVNKERVDHWMSKGAQISPTVNNLMVNYKIWDKPKMPSWKPKKKDVKETPAKASSTEAAPAEKETKAEETKTEEANPAPEEVLATESSLDEN